MISLFSFNNNANALELKNGLEVPDVDLDYYSISYAYRSDGIVNIYLIQFDNANYINNRWNQIGGFFGSGLEEEVKIAILQDNEWVWVKNSFDIWGIQLDKIENYIPDIKFNDVENLGYFDLINKYGEEYIKENYYDKVILYSSIDLKTISNDIEYTFYSTDMNIDTSNKMNLSSEYNCAADECFYSITAKLTQPLESTLNYEYSYDNETWHTLSAFSSSSNSFELKHYFNIPIYFRIRKLNTNEIIWSTLYEADFSQVDKHIIVSEKAGVEDGNEYIKTSFDFSEYFKYKNSGSYELKTFFDDNDIELFDDVWSTTIYKQGFDNFGNFKTNIKIKIDNKVVEELNYTLNEEDKEFDEIYDDILNDNLDQDLSNGDYSTVEGMINSIKSFITAISNFVSSFFGLIMGFFNALNIWIRSFIISIFVVIVICKLIKAVRK